MNHLYSFKTQTLWWQRTTRGIRNRVALGIESSKTSKEYPIPPQLAAAMETETIVKEPQFTTPATDSHACSTTRSITVEDNGRGRDYRKGTSAYYSSRRIDMFSYGEETDLRTVVRTSSAIEYRDTCLISCL